MGKPPKVLVVDDNPSNVDILKTRLSVHGYEILTATDGEQALRIARESRPDLILLDIMMPKLDGIEVCSRLKSDPELPFVPIIVMSAKSNPEDVVQALEAGADEYLSKPINQTALVARVKSMLRIKELQNTMAEQAVQLAELNRRLEERVSEQAGKLERLSYLKQFFSPHLAELIVSAGGEQLLESHRREITVVFCDLRNFTAFSHTAEPEDVMWVLRDYHDALGALVSDFEATLEHYAGDGLMVFFNDPVPCRDPAARAVRMAIAMRESIEELISKWSERGFELGFGVGIALGYATLGTIGFKGQLHYAAVGSAANLASRLCDHANQGQILITRPVYAEVGDLIEVEQLGDVSFKGFRNPVAVLQVTRLKRGTELGHC